MTFKVAVKRHATWRSIFYNYCNYLLQYYQQKDGHGSIFPDQTHPQNFRHDPSITGKIPKPTRPNQPTMTPKLIMSFKSTVLTSSMLLAAN